MTFSIGNTIALSLIPSLSDLEFLTLIFKAILTP